MLALLIALAGSPVATSTKAVCPAAFDASALQINRPPASTAFSPGTPTCRMRSFALPVASTGQASRPPAPSRTSVHPDGASAMGSRRGCQVAGSDPRGRRAPGRCPLSDPHGAQPKSL